MALADASHALQPRKDTESTSHPALAGSVLTVSRLTLLPDVTLHSALAVYVFVLERPPPRKCPFRDEDKDLLCIILEGCSSASIKHCVLMLT